jgi:hypothetical protein
MENSHQKEGGFKEYLQYIKEGVYYARDLSYEYIGYVVAIGAGILGYKCYAHLEESEMNDMDTGSDPDLNQSHYPMDDLNTDGIPKNNSKSPDFIWADEYEKQCREMFEQLAKDSNVSSNDRQDEGGSLPNIYGNNHNKSNFIDAHHQNKEEHQTKHQNHDEEDGTFNYYNFDDNSSDGSEIF